MNEALAKLFARVSRGTAEVTIPELFPMLDLPEADGTLSKIMLLSGRLSSIGLKLVPPINQGELDSLRRVVFAEEGFITPETVRSELNQPESEFLELKSSLYFDHNKAKAVTGLAPTAYKSEEVLLSSLKSIAGFLNSSGGLLIIGAEDGKGIVGIQHDYSCITGNVDKQNQDTWELTLRDLIVTRFRDGGMVNDYVECKIIEIDGSPVARVKVSPRRKLSFLKVKGDEYALFRRQGNRTFQVRIEDVEEFIELRKDSLR